MFIEDSLTNLGPLDGLSVLFRRVHSTDKWIGSGILQPH